MEPVDTNIKLLREARSVFWRGEYNTAALLYERLLKAYPEMWWLRLESERARNMNCLCRFHSLSQPHINCVYSPNYAANRYQDVLYSEYNYETRFHFSSLNAGDIHSLLDLIKIGKKPIIFHQHWLREIYIGKTTNNEDLQLVQNYFNVLKLLQSLGGKVIWTVHNLFDHDLTQDERKLNELCIDKMCKRANLIIVHSQNSIEAIENILGRNISCRVELLKHPLYDAATEIKSTIPSEITAWQTISKHFLFLSFGMMRPYKGTLELVQHFSKESSRGNLGKSILVLAGKIYDDELKNYLLKNRNYLESLIVIDRRLSEGELAYMCRVANVAVLPYRNILISGSYYQAATFSLPAIVPNIGMFVSEVYDGRTGIKYSHQSRLGEALVRAYSIGKKNLEIIGKNARLSCNGQEEKTFATKYQNLLFSLLSSVKHG